MTKRRRYIFLFSHNLNHSIINSSFLFSPMSSRRLVIKRGLKKRKPLTMFVYSLSFLQIQLIIYLSMSEQEVRKCSRRRRGGRINETILPSLCFYFPSVVCMRLYDNYYITVHPFHLSFLYIKNFQKPFYVCLFKIYLSPVLCCCLVVIFVYSYQPCNKPDSCGLMRPR
jgi:hypothetical protein